MRGQVLAPVLAGAAADAAARPTSVPEATKASGTTLNDRVETGIKQAWLGRQSGVGGSLSLYLSIYLSIYLSMSLEIAPPKHGSLASARYIEGVGGHSGVRVETRGTPLLDRTPT